MSQNTHQTPDISEIIEKKVSRTADPESGPLRRNPHQQRFNAEAYRGLKETGRVVFVVVLPFVAVRLLVSFYFNI